MNGRKPSVRTPDATARAVFLGTKVQWRMPVDLTKLRVRLPGMVMSDPLPVPIVGHPLVIARPGTYAAEMNPFGAVSVSIDGQSLGVKPGEFHFECPLLPGAATDLVEAISYRRGRPRQVWRMRPKTTGQPHFFVAEAWFLKGLGFMASLEDLARPSARAYQPGMLFRADPAAALMGGWSWRSAATMPEPLARSRVEILEVRLERLQDVTESDAVLEGVEPEPTMRGSGDAYRTAFIADWKRRYGRRYPWESDPWVRVYRVRRMGS